MKKILFIFMLLGMVQSIMAQPAARRKQAQQKAQQSNADNMTLRAKLYFPTAIPMDEDVVGEETSIVNSISQMMPMQPCIIL